MNKTHKFALGVQYDGGGYHGWQRQKHERKTVQEILEKSLSFVANHPVKVYCAGRTDTGVHALYQVIHFETQAERNEKGWVLGTNTGLPMDISVQWARSVSESFHARYSARSRTYRYLIYQRKARSALWGRQATWVHNDLDIQAMQLAANYLVGKQDFNALRTVNCQAKHAVRTIHHAFFEQRDQFICFEVKANAFLQHMVRNIMGSLLKIGRGERPPEWMSEVLASRDRTQAGMTAPPNGLFLASCEYDDEHGLPSSDDYQGMLSWFNQA